MRATADTNLLLRATVGDDPAQTERAVAALEAADEVAISLVALCEFAWVLRGVYKYSKPQIAEAIRAVVYAENVHCLRHTVEVGLDALDAGYDFADAIIAYDGAWLGGEEFLSFDRAAVAHLGAQGHPARLI